MPYTYKDGRTIQEGKAWKDALGTTHPHVWNRYSDAKKAELGLTLIPAPVRYDNRFYWSPEIPRELEDRPEFEEDGTTPVLDEKGNQVITLGLKSNAISKVKTQANGQLRGTDWMVIRGVENIGKPMNTEAKDYRAAVRASSDSIEAAITATTTLEEFMGLYDTPVDAEGNATGNAPINDWPEAL